MLGLILYRFMNQLYDTIRHIYNRRTTSLDTILDEEEEEDTNNVYHTKLTRTLAKQAEKRQTRYVGFNQLESLQTFIDTRIYKETLKKKILFRSTNQIRGNKTKYYIYCIVYVYMLYVCILYILYYI